MKRAGRIICLLVAAALPGCAETAAVRPSEWVRQFRASQDLYRENAVRLDVALLETRPGDAFLNEELWNYADEQVVDVSRRVVSEGNGFRVGQLVGMPPGKFHQLITNERSCTAKTWFIGSGQSTIRDLTPLPYDAKFTLHADGQKTAMSFEDAKVQLEVTGTLAKHGRTRLRFVPRIEHGEPIQQIRPAADRTGLTLQLERLNKTFPELAWEVTIAPNEYLVVGTHCDQRGTLGHSALVQEDESPPVQRLLVIRTSRTANGLEDPQPSSLEDLARAHAAMPLALQATLTTARGTRP